MKIARIGRYGLTWFIVLLFAAPPAIMGQGGSTGASGQLKKEELAQMLAPIALYPDALLAYPAQYHSSGVMTFMVNQEGIVYQKDLGKNTARIAEAMKEYDPDPTWKKVE